MYLGFALILAGSAVLFGSLAPLLVTPLFMLLVQVLYIGLEERMLTGRFGQAYLSYKRKVRRWI
jgi:protein-S-isoprenylcysteine O-methyltransferase Ste14